MVPTIGVTVHYQSYGTPGGEYTPQPRAAIVTDVFPAKGEPSNGMLASLCVLNPRGMFFNEATPYSEEPKPGHWSWPPRV